MNNSTIEFSNTPTFREELEELLRKYNKENGSDTPDFVLAELIISLLEAFDQATLTRDTWYNIVINAGIEGDAEINPITT